VGVGVENKDSGEGKEGRKKTRARAPAPSVIGLPEWLSPQDWTDFVAHRKAIRHPMTDQAARRTINDLERLYQDGADVAQAINMAIARGYRGIVDPRGWRRGNSNRHEEITEQSLFAELDRIEMEKTAAAKRAAD